MVVFLFTLIYYIAKGGKMKIDIIIDENVEETTVIIKSNAADDELKSILDSLKKEEKSVISGFDSNGKISVLDESKIIRIYSQNSKIIIVSQNGNYTSKLRLYEVESRLDNKKFVKISKSEIINLKAVKNFDLSFSGTICVELKNGDISYVSRRNVSKIKKILGI